MLPFPRGDATEDRGGVIGKGEIKSEGVTFPKRTGGKIGREGVIHVLNSKWWTMSTWMWTRILGWLWLRRMP